MNKSQRDEIIHHLAVVKAYLEIDMYWNAAKHLEDLIAMMTREMP